MPATARLADPDLLERLLAVFRTYGLEGATLSRISEATGLQRASLYHRFPGGKDQMAAAVVEHVHRRFGAEVLEDLARLAEEAAAGPVTADLVRRRVRAAARRLAEFYGDGTEGCLLETASVGPLPEPVREAMAAALRDVQELFAAAARAAGHAAAAARRRAEEVTILIEGSLVVARVSGNPAVFRRAIRELPDRLLDPAD